MPGGRGEAIRLLPTAAAASPQVRLAPSLLRAGAGSRLLLVALPLVLLWTAVLAVIA